MHGQVFNSMYIVNNSKVWRLLIFILYCYVDMRYLFRFTKGCLRSDVWSSDDVGAVGGHTLVQSVHCL